MMTYTIYQLPANNPNAFGMYKKDRVSLDDYVGVWTDKIERNGLEDEEILEALFAKFNATELDHFAGHSLCASDVVVLKENGVSTAYYCDLVGWKEL